MLRQPKILLTRLLPKPCIELLKRHFRLEVNHRDMVMPRPALIEKIRDKDGLLCLLTDKIDKEVIRKAERLRVIANYAVGYDNIDVKEATSRKIPVTNTPEVLTETTADLTFALILSIARRIIEADRFLRDGKYRGWEPMLFLGSDVHNKTLGIIGLGRIGRAVARRARGFRMKILYYEPRRLSEKIEKKYNIAYRHLDDLLRESDFVSLHAPLTKTTRHLIAERELSLMKDNAYLINAARGPLIDEKALARSLKNKKIAGAALDVFEREPKLAPGLIKMPNVVLVPHIASATIETRTKMALVAAENIIAVLVNKIKPRNIINPEIYQ